MFNAALIGNLFPWTVKPTAHEKGAAAEKAVKRKYEGEGYTVKMSPGSRGPFDLKASKRGATHLVQVKHNKSRLSGKGLIALLGAAQPNKIPVLAKTRVSWFSGRYKVKLTRLWRK